MSAIPPIPPVDSGYLHKSGSPAVKVKVWGVFQAAAKEFEAIIDTGFTGFLSMPIVDAFPLGLVLLGTTTVTLAGGATETKLIALGSASLRSGQVAPGVIILEYNPCDVLIGMDFLKQFQRTLLLFGEQAIPASMSTNPQPAILVDNKAVHEVLQAIYAAAQTHAIAAQAAAVQAEQDAASAAAPDQPPAPPSA